MLDSKIEQRLTTIVLNFFSGRTEACRISDMVRRGFFSRIERQR
jgi:hypothetical protein